MRHAAAHRSPGELDLPPARGELRPAARKGEVPPVHPPDVVAGGIHQLELEVVDRRVGAYPEGEGVVVGEVDRKTLPHHGVAAVALEIEVEAHRPAGMAGVAPDPEEDA